MLVFQAGASNIEWGMNVPGIVIIGAGQAGASLAVALRRGGYAGALTLIGDENHPPYQRPPLSKGYLLGEMEVDRLYLRSAGFWQEQQITLLTGIRVTEIDRAARGIRAGGRVIPYDKLALTTGSAPRRLPAAIGGALAGVHTVRTLADIDAMAPEFRPGRRLLIVGGGYIGLEAAAAGAKRGLGVTLIEAAPRILQRVAARETSDWIRRLHEKHGVTVIEGTGLETLSGKEHVAGARLADGREIPVDLVVVGIGIEPNIGLAQAAGLAIDNGIRTDEQGRTSDAHIWAAGDCASFPHAGGRIRLESTGNAIDQAETVAGNMLGAGKAYVPRPWFWSDQYDAKLQIAGLNSGYDRVVARPGQGNAVSFWYYRGDRLLALDAINDSRAYLVGKRLIESGISCPSEVVADPATDLKALLRP